MSAAAPIHIAGERLMLDPAGVLFWPATRLLVVSDLHLEKGSSFARRGQLLPPYDTAATLDRLALRVRAWRPQTIVALGDSFHDQNACSRLAGADVAKIAAITKSVSMIWVLGNHDPQPPKGLGGLAVTDYSVGPLHFRHQALQAAANEISGHFHPKAKIAVRGATLSRACFVTDGRRLLMPAFGAFTGGLDASSPAIAQLFPRGGRAFLLGQERLFSFPLAQLRAAAVAA